MSVLQAAYNELVLVNARQRAEIERLQRERDAIELELHQMAERMENDRRKT